MTKNDATMVEVIEASDEHGQTHFFEKVEEYEIEGKQYALLIYQGNEEDDDDNKNESSHEGHKQSDEGSDQNADDEGYDEEIVVMRVSHAEETAVFEAIEDEAEFERVVKYIETQGFSHEGQPVDLEIISDFSDTRLPDTEKNAINN